MRTCCIYSAFETLLFLPRTLYVSHHHRILCDLFVVAFAISTHVCAEIPSEEEFDTILPHVPHSVCLSVCLTVCLAGWLEHRGASKRDKVPLEGNDKIWFYLFKITASGRFPDSPATVPFFAPRSTTFAVLCAKTANTNTTLIY